MGDKSRKIVMEQSDFLNKLKIYINKTAGQRNPEIMASAIYFMIKQYNISRDNKKVYIYILKEVKKHLLSNFEWRMEEVLTCFCSLSRLLKYF